MKLTERPSLRRAAAQLAAAAALAFSACSPPVDPPADTPSVDATLDVAPSCPMGQQLCAGRCVDTSSDRRHCGACGNACTGTAVCSMGACQPTCPEGQQNCGGMCVTTSTNPQHCGACGNACPGGQVCSMGVCDVVCATGLTRCAAGGQPDGGMTSDAGGPELCVDTRTDPQHCGMCGRACVAGQVCIGGNCQVACSAGQTMCSGRCTNLQNDPMNCGACGTACTGAQTCQMGACRVGCPAGQSTCSGACVDLQNDPRNCGTCGRACGVTQICQMGMCTTACPTGRTSCSDRCVDTQTDGANCGMCGRACPAGQLCVAGACTAQCVMGNVLCGSRCVDTSADPAHCGGCGNVCPAGSFCSGGMCTRSCTMGSTMCGTSCVDLSSDNGHCGMCGRACAAGTSCVAGNCERLAMVDGGCNLPSIQCGSTCTDPRSSNNHCGRCGNACAGDRTCVNGACVAPCAAGERRCGAMATCTDVQRDSANCGACGTRCAAGESCVLGMCAPDPSFRVTSLSIDTAMCRLSIDVETAGMAGDQGSGLVATASSVFYNGDGSTVVLPAMDLSSSMRVTPPANLELLAADLRASQAYAFTDAAGMAPSFGASATITQLRGLSSTGAFSGSNVMLSRPLAWTGSAFGIYSGYGRIIVYLPSGADMGYWQIEMPSGVVTRLTGTIAPTSPMSCERSGHWGVAEFFGGEHYIVYMRSSTGVVRQRVRDGMNSTIVATTSTGDICTVAFSPARNRWYFQYEAAPTWLPPPMGTFGEFIGSCPATWDQP